MVSEIGLIIVGIIMIIIGYVVPAIPNWAKTLLIVIGAILLIIGIVYLVFGLAIL